MRLTVLGSSAGTPTRTNPASGYLVEHDGAVLWLDAGTGTFMELAARVDPGTLDAVVISHLHVDHCSDVFGLYGYLAYGPSGRVPVPVYAPADAGRRFAEFAGATGEHPFMNVFEFREVGAGDTAVVSPFTLTFGASKHAVPNNTVRIDAGDRTLVYSGDTGPNRDVMDVADGADLFLCEATLIDERTAQTYPFHLTAFEAGKIAAWGGAGRLVLTHVSHLVDPDESVAQASERFDGPVTYAAPGMEFEI
ncbi:MAG: MBL fold metallo-hydrolase [Acidimicrobiia bacterium]|nr:MBL fold metallo-hydrolase [Acidimicrobiia bacterium]